MPIPRSDVDKVIAAIKKADPVRWETCYLPNGQSFERDSKDNLCIFFVPGIRKPDYVYSCVGIVGTNGKAGARTTRMLIRSAQDVEDMMYGPYKPQPKSKAKP